MSYKNKVAKLRKNSELQVNILAFFITKKGHETNRALIY